MKLRAALLALTCLAAPALAGPPEDVMIEARPDAAGVALSQEAATLKTGGYYRLNFACMAGEEGDPLLQIDPSALLRDAHLRILTVGSIEIYLQGQSFRAIQCDGAGAVRFSFHPMRAGDYVIPVTDQTGSAAAAALRVRVE